LVLKLPQADALWHYRMYLFETSRGSG